MRMTAAVLIAMLCLTTACSTDEPTPEADGSATASSSSSSSSASSAEPEPSESAYDGPTIPDGEYETLLTQETKKAYGITLSDEEVEFAPDGTLTNVHRFLDSQWAQLSNYGGDPLSVGASGTLSYDEEGGLIIDEDCCGRSRYTWELDGDTLVLVADLEFAEAEHFDFDINAQDWRLWQMMTSGTFTRTG